jgi:hypothetical protein
MNRKKLNYNKPEAFDDDLTFFIVYEGKKEIFYFEGINNEYLNGRKIRIFHITEENSGIVGSQPNKLLKRAKAFKENPPKNIYISDNDKIRFILDIDQHPINEYPELEEYCKSLKDAKLFVSNFCFEVWLYFHLDEQQNIKSSTSQEMKTELGEKHTEQKINNYPKGYLTLERITKAIERAKQADIDKKNYFPSEKSTKVYQLMEELLAHSVLNNDVLHPEIL